MNNVVLIFKYDNHYKHCIAISISQLCSQHGHSLFLAESDWLIVCGVCCRLQPVAPSRLTDAAQVGTTRRHDGAEEDLHVDDPDSQETLRTRRVGGMSLPGMARSIITPLYFGNQKHYLSYCFQLY